MRDLPKPDRRIIANVALCARLTAKVAPIGMHVRQGTTYPVGDEIPRSEATMRGKPKNGMRKDGAFRRL